MNYLLLLISVFAGTGNDTVYNIYTKDKARRPSDFYLVNCITTLLACALLLPFCNFAKLPSAYTLMLGVIFGLLTLTAAFAYLRALAVGPMSYTALISTSSMIIPSFSGAVIWHEQLKWLQIIAVVFILASFVLSVELKKDKKASLKWLMYTLISFAGTGAIGVLQKIQQKSDYSDESGWFLITALLVAAAVAFVCWRVKSRGEEKPTVKTPVLKTCLAFGYIGFVIAFTNKVNLYLSGVLPSIIFFPMVNGGRLIMTGLVALLIFKEKLLPKQLVGLVLGVTAVIMLCLA